MKRWLLIPLLSLAISTQSFAQTSTGYQTEKILLSYEEFAQLTHTEQKTYVKKLREVMIEVSKAYPEMAEEMSARSSFYAQLWVLALKDAMAQPEVNDEVTEKFVEYANSQAEKYISEVEKTKTDKLSSSRRGEYAGQYREALYWSAASAQYAHSIKDSAARKKALASIAATKDKVEKTEAKVKTVVNESEYRQARDDYFKKAHDGQLMVNTPYPKETLIDYGERLPASNPAAPASAPKEEKKTEPAKPEPKKEEKKPEPAVKPEPKKDEKKPEKKEDKPAAEPKKETAPAATKPADEKAADTKTGALYRCMYAGFVIKQHPCVAPSQLPWDLKGLDNSKFICTNGTIMCNPFLFGFKSSCDWSKATDEKGAQECYSKAQPYCVKPGLYATKNCGEASNNDAALEAAVQLIHNNAAAFNMYSNSFGDLCQKQLIDFNSYEGQLIPKNTARTKADIKRTCDSARKRMKDIRQRYNVFREKQPEKSAPAAQPATGKEAKTAK